MRMGIKYLTAHSCSSEGSVDWLAAANRTSWTVMLETSEKNCDQMKMIGFYHFTRGFYNCGAASFVLAFYNCKVQGA